MESNVFTTNVMSLSISCRDVTHQKKCYSMQVILQKLGTSFLKKYHVNVHEWRFLLRVLTDKSVQRVQNSEMNAYFLAEISHAYVDGDVSARFSKPFAQRC